MKKHLNINRIYYKKNSSVCLVRFNRNVLLSIAVTLVTAQLAHLNDTLENKIIFFLDNKVMSNFLGWQCAHPQVTIQQTSWEVKFYLWRILQACQPQIISWFVPYNVPCIYSSFNKFNASEKSSKNEMNQNQNYSLKVKYTVQWKDGMRLQEDILMVK